MLYVDGGLSSAEEAFVDMHVDACAECSRNFNLEKALFGAIERSIADDELPEVPEGFVRAVTAAAESEVQGLRGVNVRETTLPVIAILGASAATLVAYGYSAGFTAPKHLLSVLFRILAFGFHSVRDLVIGTSGILRSVCNQFLVGSNVSIAFLLVILLLSLFVFSRLAARRDRI